jgi:hypothetical protein
MDKGAWPLTRGYIFHKRVLVKLNFALFSQLKQTCLISVYFLFASVPRTCKQAQKRSTACNQNAACVNEIIKANVVPMLSFLMKKSSKTADVYDFSPKVFDFSAEWERR